MDAFTTLDWEADGGGGGEDIEKVWDEEAAGSEAGHAPAGAVATMLVLEAMGSEDMPGPPPYLRAAISCGESGRDFLRSFCRRFWNQIYSSATRPIEGIRSQPKCSKQSSRTRRQQNSPVSTLTRQSLPGLPSH
jgi:hypothetical protein